MLDASEESNCEWMKSEDIMFHTIKKMYFNYITIISKFSYARKYNFYLQ